MENTDKGWNQIKRRETHTLMEKEEMEKGKEKGGEGRPALKYKDT